LVVDVLVLFKVRHRDLLGSPVSTSLSISTSRDVGLDSRGKSLSKEEKLTSFTLIRDFFNRTLAALIILFEDNIIYLALLTKEEKRGTKRERGEL
jgi:preprotein translocase subunit SecG